MAWLDERMWELTSIPGRRDLIAQILGACQIQKYDSDELSQRDYDNLPAAVGGLLVYACTPDGWSMQEFYRALGVIVATSRTARVSG